MPTSMAKISKIKGEIWGWRVVFHVRMGADRDSSTSIVFFVLFYLFSSRTCILWHSQEFSQGLSLIMFAHHPLPRPSERKIPPLESKTAPWRNPKTGQSLRLKRKMVTLYFSTKMKMVLLTIIITLATGH